jgi:glycosyltransferase involved in cell wall biosynthesis
MRDYSQRSGPAVSVIIPAYNAAAHIDVALASVFAQTFTDFEVIVINDGSPDSELLERAMTPYLSRILYLKQQNRGPGAARNLGIHKARGVFLAFLDSDDSWLPDYLSEQIAFLRGDPACDMVYSDALFTGNTPSSGRRFMDLCPSNGPVSFLSLLLEQTQVNTSGTVVRRRTVLDAGLFDENFRWAEDHDLWLRIAHRGGYIGYQRKVLGHHLVRPDSQGSSTGSLVAGQIEVLRKIDRELTLTPSVRSMLAAKLKQCRWLLAYLRGRNSLQSGDHEKAYEFFQEANALIPNHKMQFILLGLRIFPRSMWFASLLWRRILSR